MPHESTLFGHVTCDDNGCALGSITDAPDWQEITVAEQLPKEVVRNWVETFNRADAEAIAEYYADDATNHQVVQEPVHGKPAIRAMFERDFATANMTCIIENLFGDGDWAILEWRDPLGLRGCGFFEVRGGLIHYQRGYWDRLTFLRLQGLPIPDM